MLNCFKNNGVLRNTFALILKQIIPAFFIFKQKADCHDDVFAHLIWLKRQFPEASAIIFWIAKNCFVVVDSVNIDFAALSILDRNNGVFAIRWILSVKTERDNNVLQHIV